MDLKELEGIRIRHGRSNSDCVAIRLDSFFRFVLNPNPVIEFSCWKIWYRLDHVSEKVLDGLLLDSRASRRLDAGKAYEIVITNGFYVEVQYCTVSSQSPPYRKPKKNILLCLSRRNCFIF